MRDYGKVATRIWTDPKFLALSGTAKLVFLYLLAGAETNCIGCFRCSPLHIAASDVCPPEEAAAALEEICAVGLAKYHPEAKVVFLPRFLKYNRICNASAGKAAASALNQLPDTYLRQEVEPLLAAFSKHLPEGWNSQDTQVSTQVSAQVSREVSSTHPIPTQPSNIKSPSISPPADLPAGQGSEAHRAVDLLTREIRKNDPQFKGPPNPEPWAMEMQRIVSSDGRTWAEVRAAITWAHADGFWRSKVLSPSELRRHISRLVIQMNAPDRPSKDSRSESNMRAMNAVIEEVYGEEGSKGTGRGSGDLQRADDGGEDQRVSDGSLQIPRG